MNRFIDNYKDENVDAKYHAGTVRKLGGRFIIAHEQEGAKETFSIGQPVYDKDKNLMGYLGAGLYENLDYSVYGIRIPVEYWEICLPTKDCVEGKAVYTYWQTIGKSGAIQTAIDDLKRMTKIRAVVAEWKTDTSYECMAKIAEIVEERSGEEV